jgi:hypothetical protein
MLSTRKLEETEEEKIKATLEGFGCMGGKIEKGRLRLWN